MSIPEIATQLIDKTLSNVGKNNTRTIFFVGSKSVGKSTLINSFLEKTDTPRETLVIEYSFGRKSNPKQDIDKTLCHIWEYGGLIETLNSVLHSIPVRGQYFYCVMVDLSKIKGIWEILETCVKSMHDIYSGSEISPELIIIGGKYDIFKNFDSDIKKLVCTTVRSFALLHNAHIIFYSSKETQLARKAKDMLQSIGFGSCVPVKDKSTNHTKPLFVSKGVDSWDSIGVPASSIEQVKTRLLSKISSNAATNDSNISMATQQHTFPEPALDTLVKLKYDQLRTMETLDISIDYVLTNNKQYLKYE